MARIAKETVQRLAVLRALSLWHSGAYGPVRLQKTLFFADQCNGEKIRLFNFKKYYLGQYSEDISDSLNAIREAGHLDCFFDGPAERLKAAISPATRAKIKKLFARALPGWEQALQKSFKEWGYLTNEQLLKKAHEDPSCTKAVHNHLISRSNLSDIVDIPDLDADTAEELTDLVDPRFAKAIKERLLRAVKVPASAVDWRKRLFGEDHGDSRHQPG